MSAASFVLFILVANAVNKAEFGALALTYTAFLLAYSIQAAVITQAHNVLGAARSPADYRRYTTSTAALQIAVASILVAASFAAATVAWAVGSPWFTLLLAAGPALGAWQAHEFFRKICYTEGRERAAFAIDVVGYGGQALGIAILWRAELLSATTALLAVAACSTLATLYGLTRVRTSLTAGLEASAWRENWRFGGWLFAAGLGFWVSTQISAYVAAAFLGTDAAGVLKASQIVVAPLNVLLVFLNTVLPIRLAPLVRASPQALVHAVRRSFLLTAPIVVAYLSLAVLGAGTALRVLYGSKYQGHEQVVSLLALFYGAVYVATMLIGVLTAIRRTRAVFVANAAGAVAATVAGVTLTWAYGLSGAVLSMTVAELTIAAVLAASYARFVR